MVISEALGSRNNSEASTHIKGRLRKNWLRAVRRWNDNGSLTSRLKGHFTFRGKVGKGIFSTKVSHKKGSSSREPIQSQISMQ